MTADLQCHSGLELPMRDTVVAERQASAGARDGVKGNGTISLRALRCMRKLGCCQTTRPHAWDQPERSSSERLRLSSASEPSDSCEVAESKANGANRRRKSG
jgi:hypothetical protein